jgi:hypothetical protein
MSEWFHIRQWAENRSKTWCLFDKEGNMIITDVDKHTAQLKQAELIKQCIETQLVNRQEYLYNKTINSKKRKKNNENNQH